MKTKRYTIITLSIFLLVVELFAARPGDEIVSNATFYIGRRYKLGQPPNITETNITTFPGRYVYKDRYVWDFLSWTGEFDCSGLVSLCAALRRHFNCSEIQSYFTVPVDWDKWSVGDLVIRSGVPGRYDHVRIAEGIENGVVIFIEAVGGDKREVRRGYDTIENLQQSGYSLRRFKKDHTIPEITISLPEPDVVKDGIWVYYNRTVTLNYDAIDYDDVGNRLDYGLYLKGNYPRGYTFSKIGRYTIKITAIDWEGNSAEKSLTIQIEDTTPPEINLKEPPDIIWVPPSEWPGGDYKSSINYPVKISFDAIDNVAVDDVYAYVDGKLVGRWEDLESDISLSTTTVCGWNKHTLTITATDLAGNTTNFIYTFYILPERIVAFKTKIDGSYLTPFWYILTSTDRPIGEIGQSMGYAYLEPWDPKKTGSVRWASLESSYIIPIDVKEKKVVLVRITPEGYLPGETVSIGGTDIISKIETESVIYDYFDNVMWSGKSEVIQATAGQPPAVTDMTLSPPDPQKIDPVLMLYNVVRIKGVETPGGEVS